MVAQGNEQQHSPHDRGKRKELASGRTRKITPRDRGRHGRRRGGSIRRETVCQQDDKRKLFIALVPTALESQDSLIGEEEAILSGTLEFQPTLGFYIPYYSSDAAQPLATLTIQDEERRREIDNLEVELNQTGIIAIKPQGNEGLEEGQIYYWQFKINCDPKNPEKNPYVED